MLTISNPDSATIQTADALAGNMNTAVKERRTSNRHPMDLAMKLTPMGTPGGQRCTIEDISEGGMYVRVQAEAGLAVGQRVEVTFEDEGKQPASPGPAGETHFATVVRTKLLAEATKDKVGAGLRFDRPLFL